MTSHFDWCDVCAACLTTEEVEADEGLCMHCKAADEAAQRKDGAA